MSRKPFSFFCSKQSYVNYQLVTGNGPNGHLGSSFRPISLFGPANKVVERLFLPFLTIHPYLAETQYSFRKHRSTTSALLPLAHKMATGFNKPCPPPLRTVVMAIDLSKAFDTVGHTKLITAIFNTTLKKIFSDGSRLICEGATIFARVTRPRPPIALCGSASPKDLSYLQPFSICSSQITPITYNSIPQMRLMSTQHIHPQASKSLQTL